MYNYINNVCRGDKGVVLSADATVSEDPPSVDSGLWGKRPIKGSVTHLPPHVYTHTHTLKHTVKHTFF